MKTKTKIIILLVVVGLGGLTVYKWQQRRNEATIKIIKMDRIAKEVQFKMAYKDLKFETSIQLGGIRKQAIKDYLFEAITKDKTIVLSVKDKAGNVLKVKTVDFTDA